MKQEEGLAFVAGDLNNSLETAARTARHRPLVLDTNAVVRKAADQLVSLDSSPQSFAALKSEFEPHS
ncbi:MAG: hypothetical protein JWL93_2451 [Hyphomicrobiales bacterium]|jgi:hypothetical protein|nr:hypothetical protein [Hyphomicrobiales bacterium]